jgi:hypothetical protein
MKSSTRHRIPQFHRKQFWTTTLRHLQKLTKSVNIFTLTIKMTVNDRLYANEWHGNMICRLTTTLQLYMSIMLRYCVFKIEQVLQFLLSLGQPVNSTCINNKKFFQNLQETQTRKEAYTKINTKPSSNKYILNKPNTITAITMHQG